MNNNHPTISIIVPVYNVEEYLPHCLKSIQNQTFTDYECILIDDGSTDSSGKICDDFCITDKRFKVIHQENQGVSAARNIGLHTSIGKYISFIDSDDYIHPQMMEVLYLALNSNPSYSFSTILGKQVQQNTYDFQTIDLKTLRFIPINQQYCFQHVLGPSDIGGFQHNVIWNKLYKKELLEDEIFINEKYGEDTEFCSRIYLKMLQACEVKEELYFYVQRASSVAHEKIGISFIRRICIYKNIYNNIPEHLQYIKALSLYKLFKTILNVRYYAYPTEHKAYAKKIITEVRKDTWNDFLKNRSIKLSQKFIIMAFWHIPALYRAFMWYCEHKK